MMDLEIKFIGFLVFFSLFLKILMENIMGPESGTRQLTQI